MDLEWLLPQQIQQILKFCQLSSLDDLTIAANILQNHHWNLQNALQDVHTQKNGIQRLQEQKNIKPSKIATQHQTQPTWDTQNHYNEDGFEVSPSDYHQLNGKMNSINKPSFTHHSSILAQQNMQYEEMGQQMIQQKQKKQQKQLQWKIYTEKREAEFSEGKKNFLNRKIANPLTIKFRLVHGTTQFIFSQEETVGTVFDYVNCCLRDSFDNRYTEFELIQNYPPLNLNDKKGIPLSEIFGESIGEVLIVKEVDQ